MKDDESIQWSPPKIERVLVLWPLKDGQTGLAVANAFARCGYQVMASDPVYDLPAARTALEHFDGQLIVCAREQVLVEQIEEIRRKHQDAVVVTWNNDVRDSIEGFLPLLPLFRRSTVFYTTGYGMVEPYRAEGINAFWLPDALQDEIYHPPVAYTDEQRARFECEVCFIGGEYGMHEGRSGVLDAVQASSFKHKFWGCRGQPKVWDEEHNIASACSKINIAHSGWPKIARYWSNRAFKIMAAGGFVLANWHEEMDRWIPCAGPDRVLDYYQTPEECLEKIAYYLQHEDERRDIALRGQAWVQEHRFVDRVSTMLAHIESGRYFFHHYKAAADYHIPEEVVDKKRVRRYIATVATQDIIEPLRKLVASLRGCGWKQDIHVFTSPADAPALSRVFEKDTRVKIREGEEWYKEHFPDIRRNRDARFLKPWLINAYEEDARVVVLDGADLEVLRPLDELFHMLDDSAVVLTPAEHDADVPVIPGYHTLFTVQAEDYNSGVFAFRKCPEAAIFFNLWKAFCVWSLNYQYGDQCALTMAAALTRGKFIVADRVWNWLPAYGDVGASKELVRVLHNAGRGPLR